MEVFWKKKKNNFIHCWDSKKKKTSILNLSSKKKKKNFAAEGSEAKKFNLTPKSSGEMVIFEEKNFNHHWD